MLKENKGVTLVALVITIIVLLILAGVSIAMVAGDNGVLNQAVNASTSTMKATAKEQVDAAISSAQMDYMADKFGANGTKTLKEYMTEEKILSYLDKDEYGIVEGTFKPGSTSSNSLEFTLQYKNNKYTVKYEFTVSGNSLKFKEFNEVK